MSVVVPPERYEVTRRRELRAAIEDLDSQEEILFERFRVFRTSCFVKHRAGSRDLSELEDQRIALNAKRDAVLAEYAAVS
jgi:hypothetical protein